MTTIDSRRHFAATSPEQPCSPPPSRPSPHHQHTHTGSPTRRGVHSWERSEWVAHALCREDGGDSLFVKGAAQRAAAMRCRECPVLVQCRADALDSHVEFGVWGGMTERERRCILRNFPDILSWKDLMDPYTRSRTVAKGIGDPEGALEALRALNVNTERRFKRHKSSQMQKFSRALADIATRLDETTEDDDDTELETFQAIETLCQFMGENEDTGL